MKATIRFNSLLLNCPKCNCAMNLFEDTASCMNDGCDDYGKKFTVEMPSLDVKLTPKHTHEWPNGTPRDCPVCKEERE